MIHQPGLRKVHGLFRQHLLITPACISGVSRPLLFLHYSTALARIFHERGRAFREKCGLCLVFSRSFPGPAENLSGDILSPHFFLRIPAERSEKGKRVQRLHARIFNESGGLIKYAG